jgi:hypothetical protein
MIFLLSATDRGGADVLRLRLQQQQLKRARLLRIPRKGVSFIVARQYRQCQSSVSLLLSS